MDRDPKMAKPTPMQTLAIKSQALPTASGLELQLKTQRRTVDFDTSDVYMQQLITMMTDEQIWISPAYQRKFRWSPKRCSQFVESILLGIPIPSLFMATNGDSTWEVVDGLQRLSTIIKFSGDEKLRDALGLKEQLVLSDLEKLSDFNGLRLDQFPLNLQRHWWTRSAKIITLNDKSDMAVRYDLFERLNTGGVPLSSQEIRDCVFRGAFADKLEEWSKHPSFMTAVKLTKLQQRDATAEECVLRFFAFREKYKTFDHGVKDFLTDFMKTASERFDYAKADAVFTKTFDELARIFPNGIRRPGGKHTTPLNLFEGIAVGASFALQASTKLNSQNLNQWMKSETLRQFTTGATNDRSAVKGRIEFCRDRFLGKAYVSIPEV
jgi:hypothetical protein